MYAVFIRKRKRHAKWELWGFHFRSHKDAVSYARTKPGTYKIVGQGRKQGGRR